MLPVNKGRRNEYNILGENPAGMKKHSGNSTMNIRIYFTDMG
jgi:hypothetical protein